VVRACLELKRLDLQISVLAGDYAKVSRLIAQSLLRASSVPKSATCG
jgi:hypothetical protein